MMIIYYHCHIININNWTIQRPRDGEWPRRVSLNWGSQARRPCAIVEVGSQRERATRLGGRLASGIAGLESQRERVRGRTGEESHVADQRD